jgi:hypothetical protein
MAALVLVFLVGLFPRGGRLGGVAQLGERLLCKQEVVGSIPSTSTTILVSTGVLVGWYWFWCFL